MGVSVSDAIPNLAGQRVAYLEAQLKALKDGLAQERHDERDRQPVEYRPGIAKSRRIRLAARRGSGAAKSDFLPHLVKTGVAFPEGYKTFAKYHTINFPATRQVRYYSRTRRCAAGGQEGKPLPNGSVLFAEVYSAKLDADKQPSPAPTASTCPDQLLFYTAMARDAGWGKDIPEMLRNEDWNYAVFTTAKQLRPGVNQAECLACHKPLDKVSYTFTLDQLTAAAKAK